MLAKEKPKKWIQKAHLNKGGLHRALGIPEGQEIPESMLRACIKKGGHLAKMAQFALNARGFKH